MSVTLPPTTPDDLLTTIRASTRQLGEAQGNAVAEAMLLGDRVRHLDELLTAGAPLPRSWDPARRPRSAELAEAVEQYRRTSAALAESEDTLERLCDAAESTCDYSEADDHRHYAYATATGEALTAAQALLAQLGYSPDEEESLACNPT